MWILLSSFVRLHWCAHTPWEVTWLAYLTRETRLALFLIPNFCLQSWKSSVCTSKSVPFSSCSVASKGFISRHPCPLASGWVSGWLKEWRRVVLGCLFPWFSVPVLVPTGRLYYGSASVLTQNLCLQVPGSQVFSLALSGVTWAPYIVTWGAPSLWSQLCLSFMKIASYYTRMWHFFFLRHHHWLNYAYTTFATFNYTYTIILCTPAHFSKFKY